MFELTLVPKAQSAKPIALKTSPIEIAAKPLPTVTSLLTKALIYREAAPGNPTAAEKAVPVVDRDGIRLDWAVSSPSSITALHLVGRDKDGKMVGDLWFEFPAPGQLPDVLRSFCELGPNLLCRNVPTGLIAAGEYRFELQALVAGQSEADVKPKATEIVKIQPQMPQIISFQINGREAPAKLLIPIAPAQKPPPIQVSWRVQGSSATRVELLPTPGSVPLAGTLGFPLSPQGSTTIVLQIKTPSGEILTRSVTVETYDPTRGIPAPTPSPAEAPPGGSPAGGSAAPAGSSSSPPAPAPSPAPFGAPSPASDDRLAPSEQPPQFSR